MNPLQAWLVFAALLLVLLLLLWLLLRKPAESGREELLAGLASGNDKLERELRREIGDSSRASRQELATSFATFQQTLVQQSAEAIRTQNAQIDAFSQQLTLLQKTLSDTLTTQLQSVSESNARRMGEVRETLEKQLAQLQQTNSAKLDEMRQTVDEKLQTTLETRLGESFKQVADRLEQVHKGLGEMQTLAQGVGDLKHLLTNVKARGIFGEAQLSALLEQVFTVDQYAAQVITRRGGKNPVDFAIRLPGRSDNGDPVWLPIDAKFPNEDYERLLDAQQRADVLGAEVAGKALEVRIRMEARSISEKYIEPPYTTDFAILFLPTEGLYAEVLRRPGLMEVLQREHRVTLAGPTTLLAMLNSLQMGFRTLALEKRSSEVWQVLGAVKTEFGKFGDVLAKVKSQTETVLNTLSSAEQRSRVMGKALRNVEALPELDSARLIPMDKDPDEG
ncbi:MULTISPECIES: DNA recombination protein RmuC [unclassified Polaromonas]|jgi:DNA recombination protein RmuC|uniref:DNA recombination protein RmuC n=1 Tax=unclassified Polaromonas TaxID=2638319 RepID=UPI000BC80DE6|nr:MULTISPECIES: DNA recombination protein RmuC [unclassified Polaromonas]OYY38993.1 MAG: recombinase RmuC [Polaromonas sp. 35-63-35]OYZ21858.1 MAG: recombinase RmuC [Polaromonas sp. 16-63-31]OYZ80297.1 MAG: recombinase RmuC [Polaromonas sp. 24-63-21]OZA51359.1 MAG: recombinase RmuC [Polaromonas sp. 17-63-33]OZA90170.1 MAG: recombinase RmuC [Polaromonas sp. 39-63-25]